ncbi:MAG: hypothetical protein AB1631_03225 [Acidobacteriota bacterium]
MSCDFAVWHTLRRLTDDEAGRLYTQLCEGIVTGVAAHPSVDRFYSELTTKYPEIDDVPDDRIDDMDYSPWSCRIARSPGHFIASCVWSKADEVRRLIRELARKHHLAFFDPQSGIIFYPRDIK